MIEFCDVPVDHVALLWPLVRPHIVRVLDRDEVPRYRPSDMLETLIQGKARLWIAWNTESRTVEGAVVTDIIEFPTGVRAMRVWQVGGKNLKDWLKPGLAMLEDFGRAHGCSYLAAEARRGWLRTERSLRQTTINVAKAL